MNGTPDASRGPPRPFSYWLERYPPGWVSHHAAQKAEPVARATEIHLRLVAFEQWMLLPADARWDTYPLQSLSAALFNRYAVDLQQSPEPRLGVDRSLLDLDWPSGSESIHACLTRLQHLLCAPFSVFKAVRPAITAADLPTSAELRLAEQALDAAHAEISHEAQLLGAALRAYAAEKDVLQEVLRQATCAADTNDNSTPGATVARDGGEVRRHLRSRSSAPGDARYLSCD